MLTTDTYWEVDGVPLQTMAYNITTWGGDKEAPPPLRGNDLTIPYRPGTVFQKRRPTGRTVSFDMWVVGADTDGNVPSNRSMKLQFQSNLKELRKLFWNQGRQVTLTKRWRDPITNTVKKASAKAVFSGGFVPSMQGAMRASFSVDMYLSDPFFYGDEETINFGATTAPEATITVPGDYETTGIVVTFNGVRNNVRLTNLTKGYYVNVNQNLTTTGTKVVLDVDNWTATKTVGTTDTNVIGSVTNFGHEFWFVLETGVQTLRLSSTSGTGTATVKYRPRYI